MSPVDDQPARDSLWSKPLRAATVLVVALAFAYAIDRFLGLSRLFSPSGRIVLGLLVAAGVMGFTTYATTNISDSQIRRRRAAGRLRVLAERVRSNATPERFERAAYLLKFAAVHGRRFDSCYAVTLLGDLAIAHSDRVDLLPTITECLTRDDPFVRHAAAVTLYRLGPVASQAREQLSRTAEQFPDESGGVFAKRALSRL